MLQELQKLPYAFSEFQEIILNNRLYVDKTNFISNILENGPGAWFLSRPRRFGKSLTVSTLEAFFSRKTAPVKNSPEECDLFDGLAIQPRLNEPFFAPRPVIRLNMNKITSSQGPDVLEKSLKNMLDRISIKFNINLNLNLPANDLFSNLIEDISKVNDANIAVLIDEYDAPLFNSLDQSNFNDIRKKLKEFYSQLKAAENNISFIFVTGISKYSKMSLFSALNNLKDISLETTYSSLLGFTHDELTKYFSPYISNTANLLGIEENVLLNNLQDYYNGFCFDGKTFVYNPYSIVQFFSLTIKILIIIGLTLGPQSN
jgi:hypothetical protein